MGKKNACVYTFCFTLFQDNIEVKKMHQLRVLVRKVCSMMNVTEEECHADTNDIIMIVTQIQKAGTLYY